MQILARDDPLPTLDGKLKLILCLNDNPGRVATYISVREEGIFRTEETRRMWLETVLRKYNPVIGIDEVFVKGEE